MGQRRLTPLTFAVIVAFAAIILPGQQLYADDADVIAPDEPYRYVQPPSPDKKTAQSPTVGQGTFSVGSNNNDLYAATQESGAQASLIIVVGSLHAASNAKTYIVTMTPHAPDNRSSVDGKIVGNTYTVSGSSDVGALTYHDDDKLANVIYLRLPQGYPPGAIVEYRAQPGDPWVDTTTSRPSYSLYQGSFAGFGDYAIVINKKVEQKIAAKTTTPHSQNVVTIVAASIFILILLIVVSMRNKKRNNGRGDPI